MAVAGTRPAGMVRPQRSRRCEQRRRCLTAARSSGTCCGGCSSCGGRRSGSGSVDRTWNVDLVGHSNQESIGRKYQWIAYREVLALIADHFQYRELPAEAGRSHRYQGPWQNWLRDIDPTFTATPPRGRAWNYRQGNPGVWWTARRFDRWEAADRLGDWVRGQDDLPRIEDLLTVRSREMEPDGSTAAATLRGSRNRRSAENCSRWNAVRSRTGSLGI